MNAVIGSESLPVRLSHGLKKHVLVSAGGVFLAEAGHVEKRCVDGEIFQREERKTYRRLYFRHSGSLGVVVLFVHGGGVDHHADSSLEPLCNVVLRSEMESP